MNVQTLSMRRSKAAPTTGTREAHFCLSGRHTGVQSHMRRGEFSSQSEIAVSIVSDLRALLQREVSHVKA